MMVASHGMLFSDAMVQAILEDRKGVTRRGVYPQPWANGSIAGETAWFWKHGKGATAEDPDYIHTNETAARRWMESLAPWKAGDLVHVRETAMLASRGPGERELGLKFRADGQMGGEVRTYTPGPDEAQPYTFTRWTPGIHMPRWATRLKLQVLLVRVERLHEMNDGAAEREGIIAVERVAGVRRYAHSRDASQAYFSPLNAYQALWDSLNGERKAMSWKSNPWVYEITFRRLVEE